MQIVASVTDVGAAATDGISTLLSNVLSTRTNGELFISMDHED